MKSNKTLEYHKIQTLLADRTCGEAGRRLAYALEPCADPLEVEERLTETDEAAAIIKEAGRPPLAEYGDITQQATYAEKGGVLTPAELISMARHLQITREVLSFCNNLQVSNGLLRYARNDGVVRHCEERSDEAIQCKTLNLRLITNITNVMQGEKNIEDRIKAAILSETEIADTASPALKTIRRQRISAESSIKAHLNKLISSKSYEAALQDKLVTIRNGRYVVPVKKDYRSSIPGSVHDQSKGGATIFIEPQAVVELNNKLRDLELEEQREIHRILAAFSKDLGQIKEQLIVNQEMLEKLDLIFAKGALSADLECCRPEMNDQMLIEINQGRHPLIPDGKVVPISLSLGFSEGAADTVKFSPFERSASHYENSTVSAANTHQPVTPAKQGASNAAKNQNERSEQKTKTDTTPTTTRPTALVITGPNTGGKTVTLKTVGLFILMAHAGLHLPAQSAKIPYTEKVYADIGDEQSIEQSLSTFSSHMKNIVEIVGGAGPKTVALLDELGAGTDPAEGAALAVAILETLREKGTLVMATTHYTELKKYAMATDGVSNASMEFDIKTLSPTYRLRMGMPGRSNAFEISRKLGLPEAVIERAETDMSTDYLEFESVIESAEQSAKAADENRILAENLKKEADELKASLEKEYAKLNEKRDKITEKARKEAEKAVADAREYADIVKEELRAIIKDAKDAGIEINSGHLYQRLNENRKLIEQIEPIVTPALARHCEERSDEAIQSKIQNPGTGLLRYARNDGVGARNKTTPEPVRKNASGWTTIRHTGMSANASNTPKIKREKLSTVPLTLTVIGQNLDDAQIEVEKYIDDAYLAGIEKVTIIHGRGEGILRTGIRKLLLSNPHVKTYQKAPYTQGGEGATIVTLK